MIIDIPSTATMPAGIEMAAQRTANGYLSDVLGNEYCALHGVYGNGCWYFLIRYQCADHQESYGVGKIAVDTSTGKVNALTDEEIQDARESSAVQIANARGEMARDAHGYLLRYQAQMNATEWLHEHLTMHFSATEGLFIPLEHPLWQFSVRFRLARVGELKPLGVIDVDAQNGQVKPFSRQQQHRIQERVREIIRHRELATAA